MKTRKNSAELNALPNVEVDARCQWIPDQGEVRFDTVRRKLHTPNLPEGQRRLSEDLLAYPGVSEAMENVNVPPESAVIIPLVLQYGGQRLSWFSTIATIGTPQDVTLQELQIESLFPADEETARIAHELGDSTG